jgi:hypothetical protein
MPRRRRRPGGEVAVAPPRRPAAFLTVPTVPDAWAAGATPAATAPAGVSVLLERTRTSTPLGQTCCVIRLDTLVCMDFIPSLGETAPVRICSQTVLISLSTALPFGTPTIMVE